MSTFLTVSAKALASVLVLSTVFTNPLVKQKPTLTLDGAKVALDAAYEKATSLHTTGSIAVVDAGGQLVAFFRVDGSFPASSDVAIGKARTAALFEKPTANFEDIIKNGRTAMLAVDGVTAFTPLKGGIPLKVGDVVVGGIGVSGAMSADQDEELAAVGAAALTQACSAGQ